MNITHIRCAVCARAIPYVIPLSEYESSVLDSRGGDWWRVQNVIYERVIHPHLEKISLACKANRMLRHNGEYTSSLISSLSITLVE